MLEAGFTRVGEFHYLHHAPDGRSYDDVAEMSGRIVAAADATRIGLTLLPAFYAHSGFGGAPPGDAQRRFICDLDLYARLVERARGQLRTLDGADLGLAPHSLRAVTPRELEAVGALAPERPLHIHIAEQVAEVDACLAWSGARPVEWLLDHADVGPRWCLIHATHMTPEETRRLAESGAVAGLCPITEANLGDGLFNAPDFVGRGGRFGIGTDFECPDFARGASCGCWNMASACFIARATSSADPRDRPAAPCSTARSAAGRWRWVGRPLESVSARTPISSPCAPTRSAGHDDDVLDAWIFSGGAWVDCVFARGRAVVRDGAHIARDAIRDRFRATMLQLLAK